MMKQNVKSVRIYLIVLFGLLVLCFLFIKNTWKDCVLETQTKAVEIAQAAQAGISKSFVMKQIQHIDNLDKKEYSELKNMLASITKVNSKIRFTYILFEKEGSLYLLVDSESEQSKDYSPPGQEYTEANKDFYLPFKTGETLLTNPITDRWGQWISVLVPMKDPESGDVIAVFGVDYPYEIWNDSAILQTVEAVIISFCLISIYLILAFVFYQNKQLNEERKKLVLSEKKLEERERLFRSVFEQATIGIAIGDKNDQISTKLFDKPQINSMFEQIIGRTKQDISNIGCTDITHPDDLEEDVEKIALFKADLVDTYDMEKRIIKPDGTTTWIHMILSSLYLDDQDDYKKLCIIEDINKQKELERTLYNSERSKRIFLENLQGMAYRCNYDKDWTMQYVSGGCYELTGYQPESLCYNRDLAFNELILTEYQDYLWEKWKLVVSGKTKLKEEYEIRTASGEIKWVYEQGQPVYDENGQIEALEGLIIDITKRKEQELQLKYISEHDSLTGLYNRRVLETILMEGMEKKKQEKNALLIINIRNFNIINMTYGYYFGEQLIKEIAEKLANLCSESYQLFHISIERFAIFVTNYSTRKELAKFGQKIIDTLEQLHNANNMHIGIGIVELDGMAESVANILKFASIAAEQVNKNQVNEYNFFNEKMSKCLMRKDLIKEELGKLALNENENFYLVYQPIVDLKTDKIHGFEALARFESERLGQVSPLEFIPIAEETGIIVPLGIRIMRESIQFLKRIELLGYEEIGVSFNISLVQLLREDFIELLNETIIKEQIKAHNLTIELTESVFGSDFLEINEKINQMKQQGIKVSIDDFGTGYSSFAREQDLDVNCLKLDKSFIDKLLELDEKDAITGDIISMAHKQGHYVIAEGVEYERQKQYLKEHNCEYMQGYLFSKPLVRKEAIELLKWTNTKNLF